MDSDCVCDRCDLLCRVSVYQPIDSQTGETGAFVGHMNDWELDEIMHEIMQGARDDWLDHDDFLEASMILMRPDIAPDSNVVIA